MVERRTFLAAAVAILAISSTAGFPAADGEESGSKSSPNEDFLEKAVSNIESKGSAISEFFKEVSKDKDPEHLKNIADYDKLILSLIYSIREDGSLFTDFILLLLDKAYPAKSDAFTETFKNKFTFTEPDVINVLQYLGSRKDYHYIPEHVLESLFDVLNMTTEEKFNKPVIEYGLEKGYAKGMKRLLGNKTTVNEKGDSLLHVAAENDYMDSLKTLIDEGIPVDVKNKLGQTPLYYAAKNEHNDAAKYLISKKADVDSRDEDGDTQLHIAAKLGDMEAAQGLIEAGARVDADNEGQTPLYRAAQYDQKNMMSVLLGNGANLHFNHNGKEPIHIAAASNHTTAVENFLRFEVKVDARSQDEMTPIHWAARSGLNQMVEFLLSKGADINSVGSIKRTPLHEAAYWAQYDTVKYLVAHGANISAVDYSGQKPTDMARYNDQYAMRDLLKSIEKKH
uniref:Ankyrin 2,3/unc44 n=1 Tax=Riptortus pedestris TaxID=329032 RepID=R4WDG7_RIPPE|nr:ankyrin 2,3/unc44 [Riptortus pedestris]